MSARPSAVEALTSRFGKTRPLFSVKGSDIGELVMMMVSGFVGL